MASGEDVSGLAQHFADNDAAGRHPFWEPRWHDDQHCCEAHAQADVGGGGLGSHYHCPRCWAETGMFGHYVSVHYRNGKPVKVEGHHCCPNDCELAKRDSEPSDG